MKYRIYVWESDALYGDYSPGHIVVLAKSVTEARSKARKKVLEETKGSDSYMVSLRKRALKELETEPEAGELFTFLGSA